MKTLDLSWNGFEDKGAVGISDALKHCVLQDLDLSSNRISAEGSLRIIASLRNNNDLKTLKVQIKGSQTFFLMTPRKNCIFASNPYVE